MKVEFVAKVWTDPVKRVSPMGVEFATFGAVFSFMRKGEKVGEQWIFVVAFGRVIEDVMRAAQKGKLVFVKGRIASPPRIYRRKDGKDGVSLEVIADYVNSEVEKLPRLEEVEEVPF